MDDLQLHIFALSRSYLCTFWVVVVSLEPQIQIPRSPDTAPQIQIQISRYRYRSPDPQIQNTTSWRSSCSTH